MKIETVLLALAAAFGISAQGFEINYTGLLGGDAVVTMGSCKCGKTFINFEEFEKSQGSTCIRHVMNRGDVLDCAIAGDASATACKILRNRCRENYMGNFVTEKFNYCHQPV